METIKLKKHKRIKWKNIILIILIIAIGIFISTFKIAYKYTAIDEEHNREIIGYSNSKYLVNYTMYEYIGDIEKQKYLIADFNLTKIYKVNLTIVHRTKKYNDEKIKNDIKQNTYVKVYAAIVSLEGKTIYVLPPNQNIIFNRLPKKEFDVSFDYIDISLINTEEDIYDFIASFD